MGQHGETVLHIYVTLIKCNKIHLKTTNENTTVITMHHIGYEGPVGLHH